jgi:opacity protein-like surface antigen
VPIVPHGYSNAVIRFRGIAMKSLVSCAVIAVLMAPSAFAQSAQQKADLASKLLAIVTKQAQPNSGTYSVVGTATVGGQTKVYLQQEFDIANKKRQVNSEYLCTFLDDGTSWMCTNPSLPQGLLLVR